jgi:hypothetical protein
MCWLLSVNSSLYSYRGQTQWINSCTRGIISPLVTPTWMETNPRSRASSAPCEILLRHLETRELLRFEISPYNLAE